MRVIHKFLSVVLSLAVIGAGVAVAKVTSKSTTPTQSNASQSQYKPGCGPPPNGVAGNSGTHTGPPGQPGFVCPNRP